MSRSIITGLAMSNSTRTVWTPNTSLGGALNVIYSASFGGETKMSDADYALLRRIEQEYTSQTANRTYENIPTSFDEYLKLYQKVLNLKRKYRKNRYIDLLLLITAEALTGAINSYGLNIHAIEIDVQNCFLQNVIDELLSKQNVYTAYSDIRGTISMNKTFRLAPLFTYYIKQYGLPAQGVGFDPKKLSIILTALENSGIDPYDDAVL